MRRTKFDSGSTSRGRLEPAPSITSGRSAFRIIAAARSSAGGMRDRKLDRMRRDQRNVVGFLAGDVLGQLEMHRPGPLLLRHPERVAHERRDARRR